MTDGWRWRSGAALASVTAASALLAFLSLRATSDGDAPGPLLLTAGTAALALLLWPLAARSTRVLTLAAVLATGQLGAHALTVALQGGTSAKGLICCPSAAQTSPGPLGQLTSHAGWWLVAAQLLACLLIAALSRGARDALDGTAAALAVLVGALHGVRLLLAPVLPVPAVRARRTHAPERVRTGRVVAEAHRLRGPPATSLSGQVPVLAAG